jgi:hypothetical protein
MLDIHPPHEAAHTWKDFLIHIATIIVGLLIAVGLEQEVELLHHHHQQQELRQQLADEAHSNIGFTATDLNMTEAYLAWATAQAKVAEHAGPTGALTMERLPRGLLLFPDTGVWVAAKGNGRVSLLTAEEQTWYTDLYRIEARCFGPSIGTLDRLYAALSALDSSVFSLPLGSGTDSFDISRLSPAQRIEYLRRLAQVAEAARDLDRELVYYDVANRYLRETPMENWTVESNLKRYLDMRQQEAANHPGSRYVFSAR